MNHQRLLTAAFALLLLPAAAAAQAVPNSVVAKGPVVQQAPQLPSGITVQAAGSAESAADSALLTLHINGRNITAATLSSIRDAMISAGMDADSIQIPPYLQYPGTTAAGFGVALSGTIQHPSRQKMLAAIPIVGLAFARANLAIPSADVRFSVQDCSSLIDQAQTQALEHARRQAANLARAAGVRIAGIDAITVNGNPSSPNGASCESMGFLPSGGGPYQQDPTKDMNVHVTVFETVRFLISR